MKSVYYPRRSSIPESDRKSMIEIFRLAIPEIDPEAEVFRTLLSPYKLPDGREIEPQKYDITRPDGTRFIFWISYLPDSKIVLSLRIPSKELPDDIAGEFYIIEVAPVKWIP